MAISENLSRRVEADVKGSQEAAVESQVKNALSEIKNKFKYTESYISTLYDSGFKAYLKSKTFNSPENLGKEIIAINNIKQRLIKQWLEAKKDKENSPNLVTKWIYWTLWISRDIHQNGKIKNLLKWVIDECMAIPDLAFYIIQHPIDFAKWLGNLVLHPWQLWTALKQAYWDAFTQSISTPEGAYRKWRSATLIALTFIPWWLGKSLFNVGRTTLRTSKSAINRGFAKVTWKETAKKTTKQATQTAEREATVTQFAAKGTDKAKQAADATKKAEQTTRRVEWTAKAVEEAKSTITATENIIKNLERELDTLNKTLGTKKWLLKRYKKDPSKNADKIRTLNREIKSLEENIKGVETKLNSAKSDLSKAKNNLNILEWKLQSTRERWLQQARGAETADRISQAAQKMKTPIKPKGKIWQWVDLIKSGLSELPVIKQIAKVKNWAWNKLWHTESLWFRSAHPDLYASLLTKQNNLLKARAILAKNATTLEENLAKLVKAERSIKSIKTRITKIEDTIAKKWTIYWKSWKDLEWLLNKTKEKLKKAESNLAKHSQAHEVLWNRVTKFTKEIENYEKAVADITRKARNIKRRDHAVDAQIWASLLYTSKDRELDKEIQEAIDGIDELDDMEQDIQELEEDLLILEKEIGVSWLESGQTNIDEDKITIDLPEWINLSELDTKSYKITITGLASKTWKREVNERIAKQRAENAKKIVMEKYWIKDEWQITIKIDLQSDHSDRLNDDISEWQWVRIKLESVTKEENNPTVEAESDETSSVDNTSDEWNPDEELDAALENI